VSASPAGRLFIAEASWKFLSPDLASLEHKFGRDRRRCRNVFYFNAAAALSLAPVVGLAL
jgi:hypothetical protein